MLPNDIYLKDMIDFTYKSDQPFVGLFHSHSFYEVYYFHEGSCTYLIGDKIYSLSPGDLIVMYGMTLHCAKVDPSSAYIRSIIHFEPAFLRPFLDLPHAVNILQPFQELKNHRLALRGEEKEEAERILATMNDHQRQNNLIGFNRMQIAFVDLLYLIYGHCLQPLRSKREFPSEKEKTVQGMISFLEKSYMEDIHMDHLQEHLHISKFYLSKIFKEITGFTVFDFVYQRRINQAKIEFLLDPKLTVTEVCFQVGFKHLAHFSRLFKQHVGLAPEKYKKQIIEGGNGHEFV